jgi:hypothetical protein
VVRPGATKIRRQTALEIDPLNVDPMYKIPWEWHGHLSNPRTDKPIIAVWWNIVDRRATSREHALESIIIDPQKHSVEQISSVNDKYTV